MEGTVGQRVVPQLREGWFLIMYEENLNSESTSMWIEDCG
ncbi:hypothetical protein SLEP1_g9603 [Rubroshorea leprosula]|uniref:Uncharacterized protein n=1 Tax=Rubroshorea leprosula TaxID=152421 RepID=A0AAV5IET2_9ROSI|nr:hypothetical protein SLEP1_g9603 [Rubroshorea leprosula]